MRSSPQAAIGVLAKRSTWMADAPRMSAGYMSQWPRQVIGERGHGFDFGFGWRLLGPLIGGTYVVVACGAAGAEVDYWATAPARTRPVGRTRRRALWIMNCGLFARQAVAARTDRRDGQPAVRPGTRGTARRAGAPPKPRAPNCQPAPTPPTTPAGTGSNCRRRRTTRRPGVRGPPGSAARRSMATHVADIRQRLNANRITAVSP